MQIGKVFLVGAGPGDPELLTFKAAKAIGQASVILVDDLVNTEILKSHASATARITWVGKRGGCTSTPQAFIERLMVSQARAGEIVVRLKGGDPMIFGRAGEEIEALKKAHIEFEVISGISSGIAASASICASLTHRKHSHGVLFVTAHPRNDEHSSGDELEWTKLLKTGISIVLYMGTQRASYLQHQAIAAGLPGDLPVCVVQNASCTNEKRLLSRLDKFESDMKKSGISSPAVLMIGQAFESARIISSASAQWASSATSFAANPHSNRTYELVPVTDLTLYGTRMLANAR